MIPLSDEIAILGAGCFWCTEAAFQEIEGVRKVEPGYAGSHVESPTYRQVCSGNTGHAEVARIIFDSEDLSYSEVLDVFFSIHDPTSLNKQGADVGTQYRSVIFYMNEKQKEGANRKIKELIDEKIYKEPIVTTVEPFTNFYEAEDYHKNYYKNNSYEPYCQIVISPKIKKLKKKFPEKLRLE